MDNLTARRNEARLGDAPRLQTNVMARAMRKHSMLQNKDLISHTGPQTDDYITHVSHQQYVAYYIFYNVIGTYEYTTAKSTIQNNYQYKLN